MGGVLPLFLSNLPIHNTREGFSVNTDANVTLEEGPLTCVLLILVHRPNTSNRIIVDML